MISFPFLRCKFFITARFLPIGLSVALCASHDFMLASYSSLEQSNRSQTSSILESDAILNQLRAYRLKLENNSRHLSLEDCIRLGLNSSPSLASAYAAIQEQEYKLKAQYRKNFPSFNLQSSPPFLGKVYTTTTSSSQVLDPQYTYNPMTDSYSVTSVTERVSNDNSEDYSQFSPYLTMTWSFFQPSLWATISSSKASLQREKLVFDVSMRGLILDIQEAYYRLQASQALINDFEAIFDINKEQIDYVEARMNAGLLNIGDVAQAKSQFYSQASELVGFYRQYFNDLYTLAYALNLDPESFILTVDDLARIPPWPLSQQASISQALDLREEIQTFIASSQSATWDARSSLRKYLPVLSIQAVSYGYSQWDGVSKTKDERGLDFNSVYVNNSIGLGINWTFFDSGVSSAEAEAYKSDSRQQLFNAQNERYKVVAQVKKAFNSYKISIDEIFLATQGSTSSKIFLDATRERFQVGLSDMTTFVQAMLALGNSLKAQTDSILKHNIAIAELYRYSAEWPSGIPSISDVQTSVEQLDPMERITVDVVD